MSIGPMLSRFSRFIDAINLSRCLGALSNVLTFSSPFPGTAFIFSDVSNEFHHFLPQVLAQESGRFSMIGINLGYGADPAK